MNLWPPLRLHTQALRIIFVFGMLVPPAQQLLSQSATAPSILQQASHSFAGDTVVRHIHLQGNALWYVGSQEDRGGVTLDVTSDGTSQMQLSLANLGGRTESQSGMGLAASCLWSASDGVLQDSDSLNCRWPVSLLLPNISLQPSLLPDYAGVLDLGYEPVGMDETVLRHIRCESIFTNLPQAKMQEIAQRSNVDIGLAPGSLLPAVLVYSLRPDDGELTLITVEVRYSDYRAVDGVNIPFRIQRYVNGSLQLDVAIDMAQIN